MTEPIPLASDEGKLFLKDVIEGGGFLQPIIKALFSKQKGNKNCGIQSSALILGANGAGKNLINIKASDEINPDTLDVKYSETNIFDMPQTKVVITQDDVMKNDGMTLEDVYKLLKSHCQDAVTIHHAADFTESEFRLNAKEAMKQTNSSAGVIVNYHMATLGQEPQFGHHSPLGAYHEETDRFLILDTWANTEVCWAKASDLYDAMNTVDSASGKTRGYILVNFN